MKTQQARGGRLPRWTAVVHAVLALAAAWPAPGRGQAAVSWPLRGEAGPEALASGAAATAANPSGLAGAGRGEALLASLRGPPATAVRGVWLAATVAGGVRWWVATSYAHVGVADIPRTTTSPEPDPGAGTVAVSEDRLTAAAAAQVSGEFAVGGSVTVRRTQLGGPASHAAGGTLGVRLAPGGTGGPVLGAAIRLDGPAATGLAGLETAWNAGPLRLVPAYGIAGTGFGAEHRATLRVAWQERAEAAGGLVSVPDSFGRHWVPVMAAGLRLGQAELSGLRETLPHGFGAAHSVRVTIRW
jgi:hypothetical protein